MTIGLLFPGEMGAEVGRAAREEVVWASDGRSAATAVRAAAFRDVGTVTALVEASDIILSVCPPAIAEEVARTVAGLGFDGLYVEANAISPERMTRIGALLPRVVDGAIIGRDGIHLYVAGEERDLAEIEGLFEGSAVTLTHIGPGLGRASALKMAFGGWNKIGIALVAQAHAIARAHGVAEHLEAEGVTSDRVVRMAPRAWRWAPEMEEVAETCAELGLPEDTARGAAALYRRWSRHRDTEVGLDRLLDDLGVDRR